MPFWYVVIKLICTILSGTPLERTIVRLLLIRGHTPTTVTMAGLVTRPLAVSELGGYPGRQYMQRTRYGFP